MLWWGLMARLLATKPLAYPWACLRAWHARIGTRFIHFRLLELADGWIIPEEGIPQMPAYCQMAPGGSNQEA